jgi:hypothetical protein
MCSPHTQARPGARAAALTFTSTKLLRSQQVNRLSGNRIRTFYTGNNKTHCTQPAATSIHLPSSQPTSLTTSHLKVILPPLSVFCNWPFSKRFPHKNSLCISCLPILATYPARPSLLYIAILTTVVDLNKSRSYSLCDVLRRSLPHS